MKKILTLCFLSLCLLSAKAQFTAPSGDTIPVTGVTSPTVEVIGTGSCRNTSASSMTLQWKIISDSATSGWTYTGFCDKNLCYTYAIGASRTFTLASNTQGILELHVLPGCNPGSGHVKFLLWNVADSASSVQTITFKVNITQAAICTNGIAETEAPQVSFYPNPVRSQLRLTLSQNVSNGQIDIYNLIGSKVYSQPVGSTTKDMDLSALDNGIYVARISDNGRIIATKKFTKED